MPRPRRVIIMGAGGRDFHNFNVVFRDNPEYEVVAFTATQIPGITGRRYPPELAGKLYPNGIPIISERELQRLVIEHAVDEVVLAYSDLLYNDVGRILSTVLASGADFRILGPRETMLSSSKPVIAVAAVRTGAGKSTVSRAIVREIRSRNLKVVVVRHPMAYAKDLVKAAVERFEKPEDFDKYELTIEEREEYEPYLKMGIVVYAGVDYNRILVEVEKEADVIHWDGGNNDWPFFKPDYMITVADAMRPGHEINSFPGEVNLRLADVVIITKVSQASREAIETIRRNTLDVNPRAKIVLADLEVTVDRPELLSGKKAVVVEDSPTVTHGGLPYAAGYVAAKKYGAEVIDPKKYAVGIIRKMYEEYPHMGPVIPSTGYAPDQLKDLEKTLNSIEADVVVLGTPADISKLIKINKPVVRVSYELKVIEGLSVKEMVDEFLEKAKEKLE